jgi:hypothetical protein
MNILEYHWARDYKSANVIYKTKHVATMILFKKSTYVFIGTVFRQFHGEMAARTHIKRILGV